MTLNTSINFYSQDIKFLLANKKAYRKWLFEIIKKENGLLGTLNYIFCSDPYLLELNQKFLSHDTLTDIITFDYTLFQGEERVVSGDVYISIDRVKENARKFDTGFQNELKRVVSHGLLHLIGYKDKTKHQKLEMRLKENQALQLFCDTLNKL
jgi:probable rRNA maturation factor